MEYILTKSQYEFLRQKGQPVNLLVPKIEGVSLSAVEMKDLVTKKYVTKDHNLTNELIELVKVLCRPVSIQRQRLINMDAIIEQVLYSGEGDGLIAVSERENGVVIESPYKNGDDLEGMGQYLGGSILQSTNINLSLPVLEAVVLAGLWDCIRKKNLEKNFEEDGIDWIRKDELVEFILTVDSSQSFSYFIKAMNDIKLDRKVVENQLPILEEKGFVEGNERLTLTESTLEVAFRFNAFKTILQLTTASQKAETTFGSEMIILQDGVTDLMLMEIGAENVQFLSVSSLGALSMLEAYYNNPKSYLGDLYEIEEMPKVKEEAPTEVATTGAKFCAECGAKRTEGAKFCPECGNKF